MNEVRQSGIATLYYPQDWLQIGQKDKWGRGGESVTPEDVSALASCLPDALSIWHSSSALQTAYNDGPV